MYMIEEKVKEKLVNEFIEVISSEGYLYTKHAIEKIITDWSCRKKRLMEILSKHPNWNSEKCLIQFDEDYSRKIDLDAVHDFTNYLKSHIPFPYTVDDLIVISFIGCIDGNFFSDSVKENINDLNRLNDKFKIRPNMKSSKAIGKLCRELGWDAFPDYNRKYAALCDALNPIKTKRHTCISLNPIDFLYMSNGNSWNSCHDIKMVHDEGRAGCYSSGTISYMLDSNSFLFYTVDASYDGSFIEKEPKIQRQVFAYRDGLLFQSRLYPQANDYGANEIYKEIREIVQKVIADCIEEPNYWITSRSDVCEHIEKDEYATCYPDWEEGCPGSSHCCLSRLKNVDTCNVMMYLGAEPYSIYSGNGHCQSNCIEIDHMYPLKVCHDCGTYISSNCDYITSHGNIYCENCYEYCNSCHNYVPSSEMVEVETETRMCNYCAERNLHVEQREQNVEQRENENVFTIRFDPSTRFRINF